MLAHNFPFLLPADSQSVLHGPLPNIPSIPTARVSEQHAGRRGQGASGRGHSGRGRGGGSSTNPILRQLAQQANMTAKTTPASKVRQAGINGFTSNKKPGESFYACGNRSFDSAPTIGIYNMYAGEMGHVRQEHARADIALVRRRHMKALSPSSEVIILPGRSHQFNNITLTS